MNRTIVHSDAVELRRRRLINISEQLRSVRAELPPTPVAGRTPDVELSTPAWGDESDWRADVWEAHAEQIQALLNENREQAQAAIGEYKDQWDQQTAEWRG